MSWKNYQNELIVLGALIMMIFSYLYKYNQVTSHSENAKIVQSTIEEIKESVALKKVWADKKTSKRVESLHTLVPASKVVWNKKGKKLTARYKDLGPNELNRLVTKILNLPVQITLLEVIKSGSVYHVELKCKW